VVDINISYLSCDVSDGTDLAQGAYKPRMDVHSLCNAKASVLVRQLPALQEGSAMG
jgi:hypothetical protein